MADLVRLVASPMARTEHQAVGHRRPRGRSSDRGHGHRLTAAFDALEAFPVLAEARDRLLDVAPGAAITQVVAAVESDLALVVAVVRLANRQAAPGVSVESIVDAVGTLSTEAVHELARRAPTFDFFQRTGVWDATPERMRLHGMATRVAADRLAGEIGYEPVGRLLIAALLHDVGKLVLAYAYPDHAQRMLGTPGTPEERCRGERRSLGVDHAVVGGVLARRWGLPESIARSIERHHAEDASGEAALVRLADMLAHYSLDGDVSSVEMINVAGRLGIGRDELRLVMFDLPGDPARTRRRATEPCPVSRREMEVLRHLAQGEAYQEMAEALCLSVSTIRSHLHRVYAKLGVADRAQAVLIATRNGWL